jgi:hypothetical protein
MTRHAWLFASVLLVLTSEALADGPPGANLGTAEWQRGAERGLEMRPGITITIDGRKLAGVEFASALFAAVGRAHADQKSLLQIALAKPTTSTPSMPDLRIGIPAPPHNSLERALQDSGAEGNTELHSIAYDSKNRTVTFGVGSPIAQADELDQRRVLVPGRAFSTLKGIITRTARTWARQPKQAPTIRAPGNIPPIMAKPMRGGALRATAAPTAIKQRPVRPPGKTRR